MKYLILVLMVGLFGCEKQIPNSVQIENLVIQIYEKKYKIDECNADYQKAVCSFKVAE